MRLRRPWWTRRRRAPSPPPCRDAALGASLARLDVPDHGAGFWSGLDETLDQNGGDAHGACARDRALGRRLRRLVLPAHQRGFWQTLEATLAAQDLGRQRRRKHVWPRVVAAAAVAAAATTLAATWFGLPTGGSGGLGRALARGFVPPLETTTSVARVDDGVLAWTSRRATNAATGVYDVDLFALDLGSGRARAICAFPSWKRLAAVGGGRIAWIDGRGAADSLYLYDLASGTTVRLATVGPRRAPALAAEDLAADAGAALSGTLAAWIDTRHGRGDLYVQDLTSGLLLPIRLDRWRQSQPAVSDSVVVWVDDRDKVYGTDGVHYLNGTDIFAYDLTTGREMAVCTAHEDQVAPAVSGPIVVWQDGRHRTGRHPDDWDVYGYDLRTGREFAVATGPGAQTHPAISGDIVLWTERYASGGRTSSMIMGRDLRSGRTFEVSDAGRYDDASISGSTAVWCTLGAGDTPVAVLGATVTAHDGRPRVEPLTP